MRKGRMMFALLAVSAVLVPASSQAQWRTRWEYEGPKGPEHWSELDPDYAVCNVGRNSLPSTFKMRRKLSSPPYDSNPKAARSNI